MQKVFVYFHRNSFTNEVFYVGIGVKFRPYRTSGRSELWNRVVAKYGFNVEIVNTVGTWEEAKVLEIGYIKKFGRIDKRTGILVNHTDGGDGALGGVYNIGIKRSEETKKKMSDRLKGKPLHPNTLAARKLIKAKSWNKGMPMCDETKKKISESKKGIHLSDEHKNKIAEKLKGRIIPEHTRQRSSEANKGKKLSEETRKKISDAAKKQWQTGNTWYNKVA